MPWQERQIKGRNVTGSLIIIGNNSVHYSLHLNWFSFFSVLYKANIKQDDKLESGIVNDCSVE